MSESKIPKMKYDTWEKGVFHRLYKAAAEYFLLRELNLEIVQPVKSAIRSELFSALRSIQDTFVGMPQLSEEIQRAMGDDEFDKLAEGAND